jgi:hypothetical protein
MAVVDSLVLRSADNAAVDTEQDDSWAGEVAGQLADSEVLGNLVEEDKAAAGRVGGDMQVVVQCNSRGAGENQGEEGVGAVDSGSQEEAGRMKDAAAGGAAG